MFTTLSSDIERAPREQLAALQLDRLRAALARREIDADPIATLDDVRGLPFTTKDDLRASYPLGLMTVPRHRLARLHASSGTSGRPTIVGHTAGDLDVWADLMARQLSGAGVRPGMTVHNAYPYGLTTGGFGFQQGAERLGATVVPAAGAPLDAQLALLHDLRTQVLLCTPSFAVQFAEAGIEHALEVGVFGGETWTPSLRRWLESALGIDALDAYGLSEIIGPGVAMECREGRAGLHVAEDHFLVEVVNPQTGSPVLPGELGELVITTLTREAMPLIRYRTGDITSLSTRPCACGRTTARIATIAGRRRDVLVVDGAAVFPSQIERVLLAQPGVGLNYQIVVGSHWPVTVRCEPLEAGADRSALADQLRAALRELLGVELGVHVEEPGSLPRTPGKAARVIDQRKDN